MPSPNTLSASYYQRIVKQINLSVTQVLISKLGMAVLPQTTAMTMLCEGCNVLISILPNKLNVQYSR